VHLLQELMLNGAAQSLASVAGLLAIATGGLVSAWLLMRRSLAPA
jgi:hypothetical protein